MANDYQLNGTLKLKTVLDIQKTNLNLSKVFGSFGSGIVSPYKNVANALGINTSAMNFSNLSISIQRVINHINNLIEPIDKLTSQMSRIKIGLQTTQPGLSNNQIMSTIKRYANDSLSDIDTTATIASRLAFIKPELGLNASARIASLMSKASYLGGSTDSEVRSTNLQFLQGVGSNQLGGDELRSLRENAPGLIKYLTEGLRNLYKENPSKYADFANAGMGNIKELGEKKLLNSDTVLRALYSVGDKIDSDFRNLTPTMKMGANVIGNEAMSTIFNNGITKALLPVQEIVTEIFKNVQEDNSGILQTIDEASQVVQTTFNGLKPIFSTLGSAASLAIKFFNTTAGQAVISTKIYSSLLNPIAGKLGKGLLYIDSLLNRNSAVEGISKDSVDRTLKSNVFNNATFVNANFVGGGFGDRGARGFGGVPPVSPVSPVGGGYYDDTQYAYWFDRAHRIGRNIKYLTSGLDYNYFNTNPLLTANPDFFKNLNNGSSREEWRKMIAAASQYRDMPYTNFMIGAAAWNARQSSDNVYKSVGSYAPAVYGGYKNPYAPHSFYARDEKGNLFNADVVDDAEYSDLLRDANNQSQQVINETRTNGTFLSNIASGLPVITTIASATLGIITAINAKMDTNIQLLKGWGASGKNTKDAIDAYNSFLGSGFGYNKGRNGIIGNFDAGSMYMSDKAAESLLEAAYKNPEVIQKYLSDYITDDDTRNRLTKLFFGGHFEYTGEGQNLKLVNDEEETSLLSAWLRDDQKEKYALPGTEEYYILKDLTDTMFKNGQMNEQFMKELDLALEKELFPQIGDISSTVDDISKTIKTNYNKQKIDYMTNVASWYADKKAVGQRVVNVNGVNVTITTSGNIDNTITAEILANEIKKSFENDVTIGQPPMS